jgi:hypothetical protein
MNDARFITSHVRSSTVDQYIRTINNIQTSHQYRHYLQENGESISNNMRAYLNENNRCSVDGKCLPISKTSNQMMLNNNQMIQDNQMQDTRKMWYEELLDKPTTQLDFMMTSNSKQKCDYCS